jgi:hypothetical protein
LSEKNVEDTEGKERNRHIRSLKIRLTVSILLTIPIILLMWFPVLPFLPNTFGCSF